MKILKPGKVEQRKFVCPTCRCEFIAVKGDGHKLSLGGNYYYRVVSCPCGRDMNWASGEPYEEPKQDKESVRTRLSNLLYIWDKQYYGGITPCVDFLMEHGVTFREV